MSEPALVVSALTVFPVKSFAGTPMTSMDVEIAGPRGDRRWMVVDEHGSTLTARSHPRMLAARATHVRRRGAPPCRRPADARRGRAVRAARRPGAAQAPRHRDPCGRRGRRVGLGAPRAAREPGLARRPGPPGDGGGARRDAGGPARPHRHRTGARDDDGVAPPPRRVGRRAARRTGRSRPREGRPGARAPHRSRHATVPPQPRGGRRPRAVRRGRLGHAARSGTSSCGSPTTAGGAS